jgi:hypothetical protein
MHSWGNGRGAGFDGRHFVSLACRSVWSWPDAAHGPMTSLLKPSATPIRGVRYVRSFALDRVVLALNACGVTARALVWIRLT